MVEDSLPSGQGPGILEGGRTNQTYFPQNVFKKAIVTRRPENMKGKRKG